MGSESDKGADSSGLEPGLAAEKLASPEIAEDERRQLFLEVVGEYDRLVEACRREQQPFSMIELDRLRDFAELAPPAHRDTVKRFTLNLALANPELHEDTRAGMVAMLARAA